MKKVVYPDEKKPVGNQRMGCLAILDPVKQ
jgi:hypothetical protein